MILSEYEAKRQELDAQMQKLNEMESEKKMELSIKLQRNLQEIAGKITRLKRDREQLQKEYQKDKSWWHMKFRDEKQNISAKMHLLRLEYLTVNGIECKETKKVVNNESREE
jgi:hypothetical protein